MKYEWPSQSTTGVTETYDVTLESPDKHTLQFITTGTPASATLCLEGSIDGTNWFDLSGTQSCAASGMFHVVNKPVLFVRVNLLTLVGGTAPTVTSTYLG